MRARSIFDYPPHRPLTPPDVLSYHGDFLKRVTLRRSALSRLAPQTGINRYSSLRALPGCWH
jgi:hypothetical protein